MINREVHQAALDGIGPLKLPAEIETGISLGSRPYSVRVAIKITIAPCSGFPSGAAYATEQEVGLLNQAETLQDLRNFIERGIPSLIEQIKGEKL